MSQITIHGQCKCPKNSEKNDIFVFYYKQIL